MSDPDFYRKIAHERYENAAQVAQDAGATSQAALNDAYLNLYGVNGSTDWTPDENWAQQFEQYNDVPMYVPGYSWQKAQETAAHEGEGQAYNADYDFRSGNTPESAAQKMVNTPSTTQEGGGFQGEEQARKRAAETEQAVRDSVDKMFGGSAKSNAQKTGGYDQGEQEQAREQEQQEQPAEAKSNVVSRESQNVEDMVNTRNLERQGEDVINPSVTTQSEDYRNDPQKLAQLQQELYNEQERKLSQAREMAANQLVSQYTMSGANPYDDPYFQQNLDAIYQMDSIPTSIGEMQRRFADRNGEALLNPLDWNLLGFSSQQQSSDTARNLYDYWYNSEEQKKEEKERQPYIDYSKNKEAQESTNWMYDASSDELLNGNLEAANGLALGKAASDYLSSGIDPTLIDDGTSPESREGPYMTGEQYLRYREEVGVPGRDTALINPDALYSKQDEMENYGFVPYIVSDEGLNRVHDDAAANKVNNFFNGIADLRRTMAGDYTYNFDGNTYSGQDFDNRYVPWYTKMAEASKTSEPFTDRSKVTEDSAPLTYVAKDNVTGEELRTPANATKAEIITDPETGLPVMDFGTGNPDDNWYFDEGEDLNKAIGYQFANDGEYAVAWQDLPPLVLGDGQKIRADKALNLRDNKDSYADYGEGNWKKPNIDEDEIFTDANGNFNLNPLQNNFAPWITDIALGSAPLFWGPTAGAQAVGNTWSNLQGFQPGSQGTNGEYRLLSAINEENPRSKRNLTGPTGAQRLTAATASAALPATERIWGSIAGKEALTRFPFFKKLAERNPDIAEHPITQWLAGTAGEGLEEIPGNLVEEAQGTGSFLGGDYFANPLYYDEDGNYTTSSILANGQPAQPVVDAYGKQLRDQNTSLGDRNANFWAEAPLSIFGGSALGSVFSTLQTPSAYNEYHTNKAERDELGYNLVIPEAVKEYTRRQQEGE